jgi:hypothetical protein
MLDPDPYKTDADPKHWCWPFVDNVRNPAPVLTKA